MLELKLSRDDPGTERFVHAMLDRFQKFNEQNGAQLPQTFSGFFINAHNRSNQKQVDELLPMSVVWTVHPDDSTEGDVHLFSISVARLGNRLSFADWAVGLLFRLNSDLVTTQHGDERIYSVHDDEFDGAAFVRNKSLFLASSIDSAKRAVDLLRGEAGIMSSDPRNIARYLEELPAQPLRGVFSNERGEAYRLWMLAVGGDDEDGWREEPWSAIQTMLISGGFVDGESFEAQIDLICQDADWAQAHADEFAGSLRLGEEGGELSVSFEPEAVGDRIRIKFRIDDLASWAEHISDEN